MLDEQVQEPDFVVFYLWQRGHDVVGYEVGAPGFGREREGLLEPARMGAGVSLGGCMKVG